MRQAIVRAVIGAAIAYLLLFAPASWIEKLSPLR